MKNPLGKALLNLSYDNFLFFSLCPLSNPIIFSCNKSSICSIFLCDYIKLCLIYKQLSPKISRVYFLSSIVLNPYMLLNGYICCWLCCCCLCFYGDRSLFAAAYDAELVCFVVGDFCFVGLRYVCGFWGSFYRYVVMLVLLMCWMWMGRNGRLLMLPYFISLLLLLLLNLVVLVVTDDCSIFFLNMRLLDLGILSIFYYV